MNDTAQLTVTALFDDGSQADVTGAPDTVYTTSNANIATVSDTGLVTAVSDGPVIVSASKDGVIATLLLQVNIGAPAGDADGDGMPDDFELANGLDPNDPTDAGLDPDGDGLSNLEEFQNGTDPQVADTDGDGLNDGDEVAMGTNPLNSDTDGDGLSDGDEVALSSDPLNADTDGDGLTDGLEVQLRLNPTLADTDGDGLLDGLEDTDRDGLANLDELALGADPLNPDSDSDGLLDGEEVVLRTNLLNTDTDGDSFSDGIEVSLRLDPTVPDPATTVEGVVVDSSGAGVAGATVQVVHTFTAQTSPGGLFTISPVPATLGAIEVSVTEKDGELIRVGHSAAVTPVAGGMTNVGMIAIGPITTLKFQSVRAADVPLPHGPGEVAAGDLNGDGHLDLVAAYGFVGGELFEYRLSVLLGDGAGQYTELPPITVSTKSPSPGGTRLPQVAVGDFNGDAHLDLAVVNTGNGTLSILLGDGTGQFPLITTLAPGGGPEGVVAADFDRDGVLDLAVPAVSDATVKLLQGQGDGSFALVQSVPLGVVPRRIIVADFNNDGWLDLATANGAASFVSILLNDASGTFGAATDVFIADPASPQYCDLAAGQLNQDAFVDLAVLNCQFDGSVILLLGQGDGNFLPSGPIPAGVGSFAITAADLNADGRSDLVVSNGQSNVVLLLGRGDGTIATARTIGVEGFGAVALVVADLNEDGRLDVVTANSSTRSFSILLGNGDGTMGTARAYRTGAFPAFVQAEDLNGDTVIDLAVVNASSNEVSLLLGLGNGTFGGTRNFPTGGDASVALTTLDANNDGQPDVVTANGFSETASLLEQFGTTVLAEATPVAASFTGAVLSADFNHDGITDLVFGQDAAFYRVLLGNGNGGFALSQEIPVIWPIGNSQIATADFNHDSHPDLVLADSNRTVQVWRGHGDGSFTHTATLNLHLPFPFSAASPLGIATGDLNGDGHPDVVVTTGFRETRLYFGNGDGTFGPATVLPEISNLEPFAVAVGDLNGDGFSDLVLADTLGNRITIYVGVGGGAFSTPIFLLAGNTGSIFLLEESLVLGDFNGDHLLDIALTNSAGNDLTILLNISE